MKLGQVLGDVEALLDSQVKPSVVEKAHYFARSIGISTGLDALPATYGTAFASLPFRAASSAFAE